MNSCPIVGLGHGIWGRTCCFLILLSWDSIQLGFTQSCCTWWSHPSMCYRQRDPPSSCLQNSPTCLSDLPPPAPNTPTLSVQEQWPAAVASSKEPLAIFACGHKVHGRSDFPKGRAKHYIFQVQSTCVKLSLPFTVRAVHGCKSNTEASPTQQQHLWWVIRSYTKISGP